MSEVASKTKMVNNEKDLLEKANKEMSKEIVKVINKKENSDEVIFKKVS